MGEPSAPKPAPMSIADAIRRWLDENEPALKIVKGTGQIVFSVTFDTNTNAAKVRWGM